MICPVCKSQGSMEQMEGHNVCRHCGDATPVKVAAPEPVVVPEPAPKPAPTPKRVYRRKAKRG